MRRRALPSRVWALRAPPRRLLHVVAARSAALASFQGMGKELEVDAHTSPRSGSRIRLTTSLRERTPSFPNAEDRWLLTVLSARNSCPAIGVHVAHHDQPEDLLLARGEHRWIDLAPNHSRGTHV